MRLLRNPEQDHGTASCFSYDGNWHQNEILREVSQQMSVNCLSDVPQIAVPVQPCSFTENGFYSNYTVCDSERKVQLCTGTKCAVICVYCRALDQSGQIAAAVKVNGCVHH